MTQAPPPSNQNFTNTVHTIGPDGAEVNVALTTAELEACRTNTSSSDCGAQLADGTRFQPMGRTKSGETFVSMCKGQAIQGYYGALHVIWGMLVKAKPATPGPVPADKIETLLA